MGLLSLPAEVLLIIARYLNLRSVLNLSATCLYLRAALNDNLLWKGLYKKDIVQYINSTKNVVQPKFCYKKFKTPTSLDRLCDERINLMKQSYVLDNWRQGRYVSYKAKIPGIESFEDTEGRQVIYDDVYLFLCDFDTNKINVWNIAEAPFLYTSVDVPPVRTEGLYFDVKTSYQIVHEKLLVVQANLLQVFKINLPDKELPLEFVIFVDRDEIVDSTEYFPILNCRSWVIGNKLVSTVNDTSVVHVWDVLTGTKIRSLQVPMTDCKLFVFPTDDEDNIIITSQTINHSLEYNIFNTFYDSLVNHVTSYSLSHDKYTTLFTELSACMPFDALRNSTHIVLICNDEYRLIVHVYDITVSDVSASETLIRPMNVLRKIIGDRLVLATDTSIMVYNIMNLELLTSIEIKDIKHICYLPVSLNTFIVRSSPDKEMDVWDIDKKRVVFKLPYSINVLSTQSCSKLILMSNEHIEVRHFW